MNDDKPSASPSEATSPELEQIKARLRELADKLGPVVLLELAEAERLSAEVGDLSRALAGAVVEEASLHEIAERWARLRRSEGAAMAPWRALNSVLEAGLGEERAEQAKQLAAQLVSRGVPRKRAGSYTRNLIRRSR